jgi:hypothetical protein
MTPREQATVVLLVLAGFLFFNWLVGGSFDYAR